MLLKRGKYGEELEVSNFNKLMIVPGILSTDYDELINTIVTLLVCI